jgi:hypothetical protein
MDPMTMMAIVSTGMSIYGSINKGKQQKAANEAQASLYEASADETLRRAKINESITREQGDRLIGDQVGAIGSSGRALSGTAFDLLYETAHQTSMEVIRANEIAEFDASQLRYKAQLSRFYGAQAESAGYMNAAGAAIGGAYDVARTQSSFGSKTGSTSTGPSNNARPTSQSIPRGTSTRRPTLTGSAMGGMGSSSPKSPTIYEESQLWR